MPPNPSPSRKSSRLILGLLIVVWFGVSTYDRVLSNRRLDSMVAREKQLIAADAELKAANERLMKASDHLMASDRELNRACDELRQENARVRQLLRTVKR